MLRLDRLAHNSDRLVFCPSFNLRQQLSMSLHKLRMRKHRPQRVLSTLVKPVHVQLPNETVDVVVPVVATQNSPFQLLDVINLKLPLILRPPNDFLVFVALNNQKSTLRIS